MEPTVEPTSHGLHLIAIGLHLELVRDHVGSDPRLAIHCILQLLQAPVRIVFYLRVRDTWRTIE